MSKTKTPVPKRMYLVVIRTTLDELPIFLTSSKREAVKVAKTKDEEAQKVAARILGVDVAGVVATCIVTFINGKPAEAENILDWERHEWKAVKTG